jgi:hypothetical protein
MATSLCEAAMSARRGRLDLFRETASAPTCSLIGLAVRMTGHRCSCGSRLAVIAAGAEHIASLECARCETFRGWLPPATHAFLTEIVRNFGRPTVPIRIGRGNSHSNAFIKQTPEQENAAPNQTTHQTN